MTLYDFYYEGKDRKVLMLFTMLISTHNVTFYNKYFAHIQFLIKCKEKRGWLGI